MLNFYVNDFNDELDKDKFVNLESLIKNNDGKWKSPQQKNYFFRHHLVRASDFSESSWIAQNIPNALTAPLVDVSGYYGKPHWRNGGLHYYYELDEIGVVKKYLAKYKEDEDCKGAFSLQAPVLKWSRG